MKLPVHGDSQTIHVRRAGARLDAATAASPLLFQVGEQVRIQKLNFSNDSIRFEISSIDVTRKARLIFRFTQKLADDFPQRGAFDVALEATLTEGLSYAEIDTAKVSFIQSQFKGFVQQSARANNTDNEFVMEVVGGEIPSVRSMKQQAESTATQLEQVEENLEKERSTRRQLEEQLNRSQQELAQTSAQLSTASQERDRLSAEVGRVQEQVNDVQRGNQDYEKQIKDLITDLNFKTSSSSSLGAQVQVLNESVKTLRQEQATRVREVSTLRQTVTDLRLRNDKLSEALDKAEGERDKLWKDFGILTSNRKGLEARYIDARDKNEKLQTALSLEGGFQLKNRMEARDQGQVRVADLYLLNQRLGTFVMERSPSSGSVHPVSFSADSPDKVRFSDQERALYESLGGQLTIETEWQSPSGRLNMVLLEKEAVQTVSPREQISWPWMFQGELGEPETVSLLMYLITSEGRRIFLGSQDLVAQPGGLMAQLRNALSPLSLGIGALLGTVFVGLVFGLRRSKPAAPKEPERRRNLVVQKKL